jgi:hypothetical protein
VRGENDADEVYGDKIRDQLFGGRGQDDVFGGEDNYIVDTRDGSRTKSIADRASIGSSANFAHVLTGAPSFEGERSGRYL